MSSCFRIFIGEFHHAVVTLQRDEGEGDGPALAGLRFVALLLQRQIGKIRTLCFYSNS